PSAHREPSPEGPHRRRSARARAARHLDLLPAPAGTAGAALRRIDAAEALDHRDGAARDTASRAVARHFEVAPAEVPMTSRTQPLDTEMAWVGSEMASRPDWIHELSPAEIDDLDQAVAHARATGKSLGELTRDDFPFGVLARSTEEWLEALDGGRGFVL